MILATIQSSAILIVTLGVLLILRGQSASTRHAILSVGLFSALAAPLVGPLLPELPETQVIYSEVRNQTEVLWSRDTVKAPSTELLNKPVQPSRHPVLWIWLAGIMVTGAFLIAGGARIALLLHRVTPVRHTRWLALEKKISELLRLRRRIRLLYNDRSVLGTWGFFRPRVLIPHEAEGWSEERIRVVLTHELAHVIRMDWPVQLLAEVARVVYWFNPLFWLVCRWLRSESEHACDDVVLQTGIDAKDYAAHLLEIARTLKNSSGAWTPVLAMSRPPHLERRFVAMLNTSLNRRSVTPVRVFVMIIAAVCLTLPLSNLRASAEEKLTLPVLRVAAPTIVPAKEPSTPSVSRVETRKSPPSKPTPIVAPQGLADGRLFGTVLDSSGAVVPGVRVTASVVSQPGGVQATTPNSDTDQSTVTGETGGFDFPALVPGQYSIKAELPGFATFHGSRIEIKSSQTVRQNVFLTVGNIVQRVEVSSTGMPRPPAPPVLPQRIRVGGNVVAANLISQVKPVYPQSAREAGIEGTVHLQGIIGSDGSFLTLRVVSSNDGYLAAAALEAAKQWRYKPTLLNGEPIEVQTEIEVQFKLFQ